jgi:3-deoxy-D-manno-octulosonic-acid transferase
MIVVRNHPNFKGTLKQRLGLVMPPRGDGKILWLHCASLGEVKAAAVFIETIKELRPELAVYVSSMTATGRDAAKKISAIDNVFPLPFDLALIVRHYIKFLRPSVLVIMETEIWPNLIIEAKKECVPVVFVNARMTERSFRNYRLIKPFLKRVLEGVTVLPIADADAERFRFLGANCTKVFGNIKFDMVRNADTNIRKKLKESLNAKDRPVFIAGSIREGEEKMVVDAIKLTSSTVPDLVSVIAPRHTGRIKLICDLVRANDLDFSLRSSGLEADVIVVDTMGELFSLYGAADVAFVGGSLVDFGGQNILEPVAWGVPVIHGPFMSNFQWALDAVGQWTIRIGNQGDLSDAIVDVLNNLDSYKTMAENALVSLSNTRGISSRYAQEVASIQEKR